MMKKIFAMALCAVLLLSLTVSAAAETGNVVFDCWTVDGASVCCFTAPGESADVSVTAAGAPVAQTSMTTVGEAGLPVTYICMIDQSTAYSLIQKDSQRQGVDALREKLRPQDKLVVVGMNNSTRFGDVLTESQQWDAAIDETLVHKSYTTNLYYDLINMVSRVSDSEAYPGMRCVVMFTDGINDLARSETLDQAKEALSTFRFSLHSYVAVDTNPGDYALKNASGMEALSAMTPGGICVVPNRDNVSPSDSIDRIVAQVLSTSVIQMDAAQLDRGAETVELTVSLGGKTGTVSIPTAQLPDLPPVTEPETTVPETTVLETVEVWPDAPVTTEPTQAQWAIATEPSVASQPRESGTALYFLIGGGIAAIVAAVMAVVLLSRRRREEEEAYLPDDDLEFMDNEDAQDAVNSDLDLDSIDLSGLELKSDFAALYEEDSDDYAFFNMSKPAPKPAPKAVPKVVPKPTPAPAPKPTPAPAQKPASTPTPKVTFDPAPFAVSIPESGCKVRLVPENHPDGAVEFFLQTNRGMTLGRTSRADIVLNELDTALSGVHMELQWDSRVLHMRDCNSTNGTRVNGVPVKPGVWVRLENGAFIEAGAARYQVSARKI